MSSNARFDHMINHVDNSLKEILAFVFYGSIVNSPPKNMTNFHNVVSLKRLFGRACLVEWESFR